MELRKDMEHGQQQMSSTGGGNMEPNQIGGKLVSSLQEPPISHGPPIPPPRLGLMVSGHPLMWRQLFTHAKCHNTNCDLCNKFGQY